MKIGAIRYLITGMLIIVGSKVLAEGSGPPPPTPPPPPGLPIDENIIILIIIALLFGIYIIYNHRLKTKASI